MSATVNKKKFSYTLPNTLKAGTKIKVRALKVGFKDSLKTTYVIPSAPKIKKPKAGAKKVKGKASAKSRIYIKIGKKKYSKKTKKNGSFTIKVRKLKKGNKITAYAVEVKKG